MGFHRSVAGMAGGGNNVVVDHVLSEPWQLRDCVALFAAEDVVLVGVHCPLPELQRCEQERADRAPGLAARQITQVHAHGLYDIECNTSTASPADCAQQIKDFLPHRSTPTAFEKLKANPPGRTVTCSLTGLPRAITQSVSTGRVEKSSYMSSPSGPYTNSAMPGLRLAVARGSQASRWP